MKIEFIPSSEEAELLIPAPKPASNFIPEWYKNKKKYDGMSRFEAASIKSPGIKNCMPFLDALTTGYIQETWCDIFIKYDEETQTSKYMYASGSPAPLSVRKDAAIEIDRDLFLPPEFVWQVNWTPKTQDGWGILITHPLNNISLPFQTLSGIIDSDVFYHSLNGNLPFYVKKPKTGEDIFIPCGTPMYQIIPFKRESWKSKTLKYNISEAAKNSHDVTKRFFDSYKNYFRKNKKYT